jgi:large subunit ribosomal protein L7A
VSDRETYEKLRHAKRVTVGTNQTTKVLEQGRAIEVFIANDADRNVVGPIISLCEQKKVPIVWVDSMKSLGKVCGIEVSAAAVAVLEYW